MNIVEGLEGGRFALLAKVHHCMVDGVSGIDLLNVILSPQPEIGSSASPEFRPRPNPSDLELLRDELYRRVARPAKTLRAVRRYLARATESPHDLAGRVRALGGLLGSAFRRPSATPLNRPIGGQRRIDWLTTARAPVEEIRRRFGGSLNDVVLAVVTAAMRRTLNRRQVSLAAMNLRAMTPVDVRSDAERGTVGNRVAAWLVDLPVREPDPREQLHQIHASTLKLKEAGSPVGSAVLGEMSEWTSSALLISLSARYVTHLLPCNLVVTNIPGPPCTVHLLEAPLSEAFPLVPITHGLGLNVGIMTYDRKVCWGFTADYDLVPDLDTFARDIEESFEALRRAALPVDISSPQPTSDPEPSTRDSRRVGAAQEKRKRSHPPKARPESRP
jgi:WS/DGAT/MGAT family acyltransferase